MARWLKAEFLHSSRIGGFFILVDLLSGCGARVGVLTGVGSGEGWAGHVAGVGVMGGVGLGLLLVWGESGRYGGGRGVCTSISVLVGVVRGVVSFCVV